MASMCEIRSQLKETEALEALAAAYSSKVQYSLKSLVYFGGLDEEISMNCPAPGFVLSFNEGNYLHIKQDYTQDWLIGRVVGSDTGLGFIPCENLLQAVIDARQFSNEPTTAAAADMTCQTIVYQKAPIIRPVVFLGPSLKGCELTDLLQKALLSMLKKKFSDRLLIVKSETSISSLTPRQASELKSQVYEAGKNDRIVYLDCNASYPTEINSLELHPLLVYIQVNRLIVLEKLIRETCRDKQCRQELITAANQLYDLPRGDFSLILTDSHLEDASLNLELFIESYWASTHPPVSY